MTKFNLGELTNNTKFSRCADCKERCHSCVACGWVFTCKCTPCHEGDSGHQHSSYRQDEITGNWFCNCGEKII